MQYKVVNATVLKSAITALDRYRWYLTTEMVPLALFSDLTPSDERHNVNERLLVGKSEHGDIQNTPRDRFGTGFSEPHFPTDITQSTTPANFVANDSWCISSLLLLDSDFLTQELSERMKLQTKIDAINVINDCAEIWVKLSAELY